MTTQINVSVYSSWKKWCFETFGTEQKQALKLNQQVAQKKTLHFHKHTFRKQPIVPLQHNRHILQLVMWSALYDYQISNCVTIFGLYIFFSVFFPSGNHLHKGGEANNKVLCVEPQSQFCILQLKKRVNLKSLCAIVLDTKVTFTWASKNIELLIYMHLFWIGNWKSWEMGLHISWPQCKSEKG